MVRHLRCSHAVLALAWMLIAAFTPSSVNGQMSTLPNGIASGDVTQTSAVLWAHSAALGEVTFELYL
jgi:phosphodiesterase/alkaline phosphatase D-like protein